MGIQIYDQISTIRNCSKVKLCHAFLLGLGLKVVKIDWNIVKFGVHSENLVKAETASCSFVKVLLKDAENRSQHRESWHALLSSKCAFKSMIKF